MSTKSFLVDLVHDQAYRAKFANIRFPGSSICPSCHSEFAHVLKDTGDSRMLWCHSCGTTYVDRSLLS